jgi:hypothetical protein
VAAPVSTTEALLVGADRRDGSGSLLRSSPAKLSRTLAVRRTLRCGLLAPWSTATRGAAALLRVTRRLGGLCSCFGAGTTSPLGSIRIAPAGTRQHASVGHVHDVLMMV